MLHRLAELRMDETAQRTFMVRNGPCCIPGEWTTRVVQVRDRDDIQVQESGPGPGPGPGPGAGPHPSQQSLLHQQGSLLHQQGSVLRQQGAAVGLHLLQPLGQMSVGGLQLHHPVQSHSELQGNQKRLLMRSSRELKLLQPSNTSPLSAASSSPPLARPPSARRFLTPTCSVSPDPRVGSPVHQTGSGSITTSNMHGVCLTRRGRTHVLLH